MGLLHELIPHAKLIAVLINPSQPAAAAQGDEVARRSTRSCREVRRPRRRMATRSAKNTDSARSRPFRWRGRLGPAVRPALGPKGGRPLLASEAAGAFWRPGEISRPAAWAAFCGPYGGGVDTSRGRGVEAFEG